MRKKQINQLVLASYTKNALDDKKVAKIANSLSRKDLKVYIRGLKLAEKKKKIYVALPSASVYNTSKKIFINLFPGRQIEIEEDKLLMLGGRVMADDMVYDFSLKNRLDDFLAAVEQNYDEE